jgi:hypothetical protein
LSNEYRKRDVDIQSNERTINKTKIALTAGFKSRKQNKDQFASRLFGSEHRRLSF